MHATLTQSALGLNLQFPRRLPCTISPLCLREKQGCFAQYAFVAGISVPSPFSVPFGFATISSVEGSGLALPHILESSLIGAL
jgi:hypothetical protein